MSDEAKAACGRRLRAGRVDKELTQEALAGMVGVSQPSLHQWEKGETWPTYTNRLRLAEVLGFDAYAIEITADGAVA